MTNKEAILIAIMVIIFWIPIMIIVIKRALAITSSDSYKEELIKKAKELLSKETLYKGEIIDTIHVVQIIKNKKYALLLLSKGKYLYSMSPNKCLKYNTPVYIEEILTKEKTTLITKKHK